MAKNEQLAGEGDLATSSAPRRQSARIQSQQLRASRELEHLDEEESMRGRKRKRTAAPASKSLENGGVGESLKKEAMTKEEQYVTEKELLARRRAELLEDEGHGKKMANSLMRRRVDAESQKQDQNAGNALSVDEKKENVAAETDSEVLNECGGEENGVVSAVGNVANVGEKSDYAKVKETLRLFNKHYLHFVQEEEKRCRKEVVEQKAQKGSKKAKKGNAKKDNMKKSPKQSSSKTKTKEGDADLAKTKKLAKRPDLKAITKMLDNNDVLNAQKRIGEIPGIRVGHQFYSRAEMVVVGFHSHWLNGIDYMGQNYKKMEEYKNYEFPLAVAIVLSGMYEDDLDNAEDIVYTGQGGHNLTGDKRQIKDQTLERGNLALKNCMVNELPVRVIRGHENRSSYTGKVYTYDGLYKVIKYWADKGISGFTVYKYLLRRVVGQPMLTTNQVQFVYGRVPQSVSDLRGLVCEDIAGGQENFPIPATNLVDDPPVPPSGFKYISSIQTAKNVVFPATVPGCSCKGMCIDPRTCACAKLNGSDFPYVQRDGGRLIEAKDVVYECGPKCGCGPDCINRVSQRGLKYHLEVFRAPRKGWAVRSWDFIPSGAPVCEYIGILKKSEDMENASENNYIFDIDCLQTMRGLGGRERRSGDLSIQTTDQMDSHHEHKYEPEFCIDAGARGNIARFINHSCEPNLFVQCVLSSHHDMKLARVVLFAADNIPPLQELTYDYGYALDSVLGADGKVKRMPCYCGAADCRKRLF